MAAHWHTAAALDWTARPVTAPHPETTHGRAEDAMAADCDALHWHAKSVSPQPTPDAAAAIQETWDRAISFLVARDGKSAFRLTAHSGTFAATAAHCSWA